MFDRRRFLQALSALGFGAGFAAQAQPFNPKPRFTAFPFTLGVASGYPSPVALTLWTRLAPVPDAPGGGMAPEVVPVLWEIARDEAMKDIAASGTTYATPEWAHTVHVEPAGLQSNRQYWYRFSAGDAQARSAAPARCPSRRTAPPGCALRSPPASNTSRVTTAPTSIWRRTSRT